MDNISTNVSQIQADLHSSRALLATIEIDGKKQLTTEVSSIRDAVKVGDNKLIQANSQVRSYLLQIEDVPEAEMTVDMKPQMVWLHKSLESIVISFGEAQAAAPRALLCTAECSYHVLDVGQEVEKNRERLSEYQKQSEALAAQASNSLQTSEFLLRDALEQISQKESEIWRKTSEPAGQWAKKRELEGQISQKEAQICQAESKRQDKKESAALAAVVGAIGILAALATLGLSLGVTAVSAGVAGHKISPADDYKAEANALRSSISNLNSQIAQSTRDAASLEQEKTALESRVRRYESEIRTRQIRNREYEEQITEATKIDAEIKQLDSHAQFTAANVHEDYRQLQKWKQTLDDCNALIHTKKLEVGTEAGVVEWVGSRRKRSVAFKRQKKAMEELVQTLDKIRSQVPMLLPQGEKMKFLDNFGDNSGSEGNLGRTDVDEMPPVTFHTT